MNNNFKAMFKYSSWSNLAFKIKIQELNHKYIKNRFKDGLRAFNNFFACV